MVAEAELGPAGCDGGAETEDSDGWGGGHLWICFGVLRDFVLFGEAEMFGGLDGGWWKPCCTEGIIPSALPGTTTPQPTLATST